MFLSIPVKLILALIIGAVIGLERESYEDELTGGGDIRVGGLGVRTFSLITLLGATAGLLQAEFFSLFIIINVTFMLLVLSYYIFGSILNKDNGFTTELAVIFAYLSGLFISLEVFPIQLIIALVVVLILILSYKQRVRAFVAGIKRAEVNGFISYATIAFVILPFLPNISFSLQDIPGLLTILASYGVSLGEFGNVDLFNPFSLWLVVALITGVDVLGYVMERAVGQKSGWLLTSLTGGFISSTATTQSLANQSRTSSNTNLLVASAVFANMASFIQLFLLIAFVNGELLVKSTGMIVALLLSSTLTGMFFLDIGKNKDNVKFASKDISSELQLFSIGPALKFAVLFLVIKTASKFALLAFGNSGFLFTTSIAALAGLDAVTINIAQLSGTTIGTGTAILAIIIANAVNLTGKATYSMLQGSREFALKFAFSMFIIIFASLFGLIF